MSFDFGDWISENGTIKRICLRHDPCSCRDLHSFKKGSSLPSYLRKNCKGWVETENGQYNLNYIFINLLSYWYEKGIIEGMKLKIKEEEAALIHNPPNYYQGSQEYLRLPQVKHLILAKHFVIPYVNYKTFPFFICPFGLEPLIAKFLTPDWRTSIGMVYYYCKPALNQRRYDN